MTTTAGEPDHQPAGTDAPPYPEEIAVHNMRAPDGRVFSLHPPVLFRFAGVDCYGYARTGEGKKSTKVWLGYIWWFLHDYPLSYRVPPGSDQEIYDALAEALYQQWSVMAPGGDSTRDSPLAELERRGAPPLARMNGTRRDPSDD